jgi:bisphosphoglycerate-independent phosphoglycerate mutase (AlkP superfamily)
MNAGVLALIIILCNDHTQFGQEHSAEEFQQRRECKERAVVCMEHYKSTTIKVVNKCVEEGVNDSAAKWATDHGYRKTKTATKPYFKKFWPMDK